MASIKLYLDTRTEKVDKTYPLKISVSHKNTFLIPLGVSLTKDQWLGEKVVDHTNAKRLNSYIGLRIIQIKSALIEIMGTGRLKDLSDKELKVYLTRTQEKNDTEEAKALFITGYNSYVKNLIKKNTIITLTNTYKKIAAFCDIDNLSFEDMSISWMKDFDNFMVINGLSANSRGIYFRNIRAIFNDSIDRENIPQSNYPFRRFKIPKEATQKRSLTLEQLVKLRNAECEPFLEKYRDLFMLLFYLIGINMIDLLHLKEIKNGRVEYKRNKTGKLYSFIAPPEALTILKKYKGKNYLLNIMDSYSDYRDFTHRMNNALKKLKYEGQIIENNLSTYYARHTWATIAAKLDIPKETIAAALGHGGNSVTDIYINFDRKKVDEANTRVIAALYREEKSR